MFYSNVYYILLDMQYVLIIFYGLFTEVYIYETASTCGQKIFPFHFLAGLIEIGLFVNVEDLRPV